MRSQYNVSDYTSTKPPILAVVGRYIPLKKLGKEYRGPCPFHADKNPSLSINEEKGLFYCFGCQQSGDAFDFIMRVEGVGFRDAKRQLGMGGEPPADSPGRQAAEKTARWINEQAEKMRLRLYELDEMLWLADEVGDVELGESIWRERRILGDLFEDLRGLEYRPDFVQIRDVIENITRSFE